MKAERDGNFIDSTFMKNFIHFMQNIVNDVEPLYSTDLEKYIIEDSKNFYLRYIPKSLGNLNFIEFIGNYYSIILNEKERLLVYLPESTIEIILEIYYKQFFFDNSKILLENGLLNLLINEQFEVSLIN